MKSSLLLSVVALATQSAYAFPSHLSEAMLQLGKRGEEKVQARAVEDCPFAKMKNKVKRQLPGVVPPFDATAQYVSNQGAHAFVAPSGTDQRGPCKFSKPLLQAVVLTFR
jgi:hypothetical protein